MVLSGLQLGIGHETPLYPHGLLLASLLPPPTDQTAHSLRSHLQRLGPYGRSCGCSGSQLMFPLCQITKLWGSSYVKNTLWFYPKDEKDVRRLSELVRTDFLRIASTVINDMFAASHQVAVLAATYSTSSAKQACTMNEKQIL